MKCFCIRTRKTRLFITTVPIACVLVFVVCQTLVINSILPETTTTGSLSKHHIPVNGEVAKHHIPGNGEVGDVLLVVNPAFERVLLPAPAATVGKYFTKYQPISKNIGLIWKNMTQGVMACQTGDVVRPIHRPHGQNHFVVNVPPGNWKSEHSVARKSSFIEIFKKNIWVGQMKPTAGNDAIIGSGPGSTLENSINVRRTLDVVISQIKISLGKSKIRMLDIPCGDLTWMSEFIKDREDVEYYGMDIVPEIIEHHQGVYTPKYPHMIFINQDIVAEALHAEFDLIHTREMTQHLTSADTLRVFKHFKDSGSRFLMATSYPGVENNELKDLVYSRWVSQDLESAPYLLPAPICQSFDIGQEVNLVWLMN